METPDRRAASSAQKNQPTNEKTDLEVFLRVKGPELLQKHAANILMVVLLLIAAGFFLYTRSRNKAIEQEATNQNTAIAYDYAQQARDMFNAPVFNDAVAHERQQKVRDTLAAVEAVLTSDAGSSQKAAAQLAKADVLWLLANAPAASLTTTQPASGFELQSSAEYLDRCEEAYTSLLSNYANEKEYAANALLGLAAVSETRGKFDDAKAWYDKVIADGTLRPLYHEMATSREQMLADVRKPYALAKPTSQPATTMPAMPTTAPSAAPLPAQTSSPAASTIPSSAPAGN